MELIKKNIHMDYVKCQAASQITLEEDMIVPDSKPDIDRLIYDKGTIKIDEIKALSDHVSVKGKLIFQVLYLGDDEERAVNNIEGSIPFEEQIYMEGVEGSDAITLDKQLEDITIGLINPRKISAQAVLTFHVWVDELMDEESGVDIHTVDPIESQKKGKELAEIVMQKKDIYRIKQEAELPSSLPNVFCVIWNQVKVGDIEFKALDNKISVQGDINVFLLYEGEGEDRPVRWYETTVPFSGVIDCYGCKEYMIADVYSQVNHAELEVRPDFDGEERVLGIDVVLDLCIKLYEEIKVDFLTDAYGICNDIELERKEVGFKNLLIRNTGKTKVTDRIKIKATDPRVLQICNSCGDATVDDVTITDNGVEINGSVAVKVLYVTNDDKVPFFAAQGEVPFSYNMEVPGVTPDCEVKICCNVESINVTMIDSEELDVKVILCFVCTVFSKCNEMIVTDVTEKAIDLDKLNDLPGMVVYIAKDGDSLWEIGKKYYTPISTLKEMNGITGDVKPGDKILVVKSLSQ